MKATQCTVIAALLCMLAARDAASQVLAGGDGSAQFLIDLSTNPKRTSPYTDPPLSISGQNESIDTTYETVWSAGGIRPLPPPAGLLMSLKSTDADDNSTGTGARTVLVGCLDPAGFRLSPEMVSMNGSTLVPMISSCYRIISAAVIESGTSLSNEGTISFENAATVYEEIGVEDDQGFGVPHSAAFTIPAGRLGSIGGLSILADTSVSVQMLIHRPGRGIFFIPIKVSGSYYVLFEPPLCFSALTDIEIRAKKPGGGAVPITVSFSVILLDSVTGTCPSFF